jgi:cytochrome c556
LGALSKTAVLVFVVSLGALRAQQPAPAPATPPKPLVPVAASTLAMDPAPFFGQTVTLMAAVEQRISPAAFSVDQDKTKSTGNDVLILTRALHGTVTPNTYVTVIGEVVRFDPGEIGRRSPDYLLDLPADVSTRFGGRAVVLATAVIDASMMDLTKKLPPKMTPDEEAYDKIMKRVGPAFTALRQGVSAANIQSVRDNVVILKQSFVDTEDFWKKRGKPDATGWAQDARKHSDALFRAAEAEKWDDVKASATALGQSCQSCHGVYRERHDDGTYRIKQ